MIKGMLHVEADLKKEDGGDRQDPPGNLLQKTSFISPKFSRNDFPMPWRRPGSPREFDL